ncbi:MAG: CHAP domain-containing protein [Myxococcota bacterium]|nr:CHAP domain-containing protein [Myxococcota bacterium]
MSALLLAGLLVGCSRRGIRTPGSLSALGGDAAQYDRGSTEASSPEPPALLSSPPRRSGDGQSIADGAVTLIGKRDLVVASERYRYDCSGMVCAAYAAGGQTLSGSSKGLYAEAVDGGVLHTDTLPRPGDIAFFDNSYDRNRNGQRDDELTHVAVVEAVADDGTITLIHLGSGTVSRIKMNLLRPEDSAVNSYLRARADLDGGPRLTGELWRGFASFWALPEG